MLTMTDTRLILVDGLPGSGKSTLSKWLSDELSARNIGHTLLEEQVENHPLRIYDPIYTDFTQLDQSREFRRRTVDLYWAFVASRRDNPQATIVDGWFFGATIGFTMSFRMDWSDSTDFAFDLMEMVYALDPVVIYIAQADVEMNWRRTCEMRGDEWVKKHCGFTEDIDYVKAGISWSAIQEYCLAIIRSWTVPKLIIENTDYDWDDHKAKISEFLELSGT